MPKVLFTSDRFKDLSAESKTLYGIMLDRVSLSVKHNWIDEGGRVYIIYTIEQIMAELSCGNKKAVQLLDELERKAGLIERKRQGLGKPNLIYVKNFISAVDNSVGGHFLKCQNDTSGSVKTTSLEVSKRHGTNTDLNNTDYIDTDPIVSGSDDEGMRIRKEYEEYFRSSLEIEVLLREDPYEEETIMGILDILVDTCSTKRKAIRIAGDDKPTEAVKSQLMKLTTEHIRYVLKCLTENSTKVRNIRQYLLTALYNAPTTISTYYQAWVNNDMAEGML